MRLAPRCCCAASKAEMAEIVNIDAARSRNDVPNGIDRRGNSVGPCAYEIGCWAPHQWPRAVDMIDNDIHADASCTRLCAKSRSWGDLTEL